MHAIALLITLLEGANRSVQGTIESYFKLHTSSSFFRVAHQTLLETKDTLRDQKKLQDRVNQDQKQKRKSCQAADGRHAEFVRGFSLLLKPDEKIPAAGQVGRTMMWLRLLQVLCSGQCAPLQNLVRKQASLAMTYTPSSSTAVLSACIPICLNRH